MNSTTTLTGFARRIAAALDDHFDHATAAVRQLLAVAEEAGEFVGAYRRAAGLARRPGTWDDVRAESADVVITAYVTAVYLGIDHDTVIVTSGWRTTTPTPTTGHAA